MCWLRQDLDYPPKATSGFFMVLIEYMKRALELAESARGRTRSNPLVGAVVVKAGAIIAEGLHRSFGSDHAEVDALKQAGEQAVDADLYVTLEPCTHFGKTPPCVEAVKTAGIKRVIAATIDPNPVVNGAGIRALQHAGIEVVMGVCESEARRLNEVCFKFITTGLPFVTLKIAQTLDGRIADAQNNSKWITSEQARAKVHRLRSLVDAVLIGAHTMRIDDPELSSHGQGSDPLRIVLSRANTLPSGFKLTDPSTGGRTILATSNASSAVAGLDTWLLGHKNSIFALLETAAAAGVSHLLVEGGRDVFSQFIEARLVDKFIVVIAPQFLGDGMASFESSVHREIGAAIGIEINRVELVGGDVWIEAYPR